ncbi:MAG: hypothetical protein AAB316_00710 [Bacteroidota bacterium]
MKIRRFHLPLILLFSHALAAQFHDDFSDGDLTNYPTLHCQLEAYVYETFEVS